MRLTFQAMDPKTRKNDESRVRELNGCYFELQNPAALTPT